MFLLCIVSLAGTVGAGFLLYPHGVLALLLAPVLGSLCGVAAMAFLATLRGWDLPEERPARARAGRDRGVRRLVHRHA